MPRKPSDQVITHRLEFGLKEREHLETVVAPLQVVSLAKAAGMVVGAGALGVAAYGLYWWFDSREKIAQRINDNWFGDALVVSDDDNTFWDVNPITGWGRLIQRAFGIKSKD